VAHLRDRPTHRDTGIVEHNVHSAERAYDVSRERDHRVVARHVAHTCLDTTAAEWRDLARGWRERGFLHVDEHDVCPTLRELLRGCEPNPARPTGDHGDLVP
jgi:hypothetical protein